ncbi:MAG TPA: type II toxin-antitoxin system HicB family antitoxin [Candidatus Nitrosotenuis sp.]|jgi:predicted RNase H-like HicB family nuclease|nr:type II toxin-antitoxin system HicB family antitoxin [Candidatus Nitrosotenuis sp.]
MSDLGRPYRVTVRRLADGSYEAVCGDFAGCRSTGSSQEEAVSKMREALAFYLEDCPCGWVDPRSLRLEVISG